MASGNGEDITYTDIHPTHAEIDPTPGVNINPAFYVTSKQ